MSKKIITVKCISFYKALIIFFIKVSERTKFELHFKNKKEKINIKHMI